MAPRHVTEFVRQLTPMATEIGARYGIDPALIITQAAIESGWGQSVAGNNYFGVKSHGQPGGQTVLTKEEVNGQLVPRYEQFRSYGDLRGSMEDYARFLKENPRYEGVFQAQNLAGQIDAIAKSGYATDSAYPALLEDVSRMVQSNMLPVPPGEIPNVVGTARDVVPPPAPVPVTPSPSMSAMRSAPNLADVPLPRPRPNRIGLRPFDPARDVPRDNGDGTFSTEVTRTVQMPNGEWTNVPSLWWGENGARDFGTMGDDQLAQFAARYEQQTGQTFPRYRDVNAAEQAAIARSNAGGGASGSIARQVPPLPRPRPSAPDIVTETMALLNNRPSSMGAADSLAMNPVTGQAVPDLNAGRYTGPGFDASYSFASQPWDGRSGARVFRPPNMTFGELSYAGQDRGGPTRLPAPAPVAPMPAMQSTDMRLMRQPFVTPPSNPMNTETARLASLYAGGGPTRPNMNAAERLLPQGNLAPRVPMAMPSAPPIMINPVQVASAAPMPMPAGMRPMGQRMAAPVPMPSAMRPMAPVRQAVAPQQAPLRVVVNGGNVQRQAPTREQQIAAILAQSRGTPSFGGGGSIDGAVQPTGTLFKRA